MTGVDDLDRRFLQFLEDGPIRSPERPVEAALAHARAHPRRRDPLAVLRRDPMAPRSAWSARPALVLAALSMLVVLSAAAVFVGSQRQPSIAPVPSAPTTATAPPSASPVPTPREFSAEIVNSVGQTKSIVVVDESGLLENVFAGEPADPDRPQNAEIEAVQVGADEGGGRDGIVLHWVDMPCGDDYRLTIDETARELVLDSPRCEGDTTIVNYQVWLDFSEPVPAAAVEERLVRS